MKKDSKHNRFYLLGATFTGILLLLVAAQMPRVLIVGFLLLPVYFLPTLIVVRKSKAKARHIFLLNFFLGWFFVYWVVMLQWALANNATEAKESENLSQVKIGRTSLEARKVSYLQA